MLDNITRGTKLGSQLVIQQEISNGKYWGVYKTFTDIIVLCITVSLANKWIASGLVSRDIFHEHNEMSNILFSTSMKGTRLEYLPNADSPESIDDAISFAISLRRTRDILGANIDLGSSIFYEQYSCLLPTYENENTMADDIVLGRWLTGGVPISAKNIGALQSLMTWTSPSRIKKVVNEFGIENEELESNLPENIDVRRETSEEEFILYGRKELTDFFNDHVIDIVRRPDEYAVMGINFPGSIIMYGPPGSGKTYAAEALVDFLGWPSYYINSGTIGSKYIHETSKKIAEIFDKAMEKAPSVIVIDEMESFLSSRSDEGDHVFHNEEVGEFLRLLQKAKEKNVLVLAMTNMVDSIDEAVKRRGRFDHVVKVDMPSLEEIKALLSKLFAKLPMEKSVHIDDMAKALQGQSMADVAFLVKEAGRRTVKARKQKIDQSVIDEIIEEIKSGYECKKAIGFRVDKDME